VDNNGLWSILEGFTAGDVPQDVLADWFESEGEEALAKATRDVSIKHLAFEFDLPGETITDLEFSYNRLPQSMVFWRDEKERRVVLRHRFFTKACNTIERESVRELALTTDRVTCPWCRKSKLCPPGPDIRDKVLDRLYFASLSAVYHSRGTMATTDCIRHFQKKVEWPTFGDNQLLTVMKTIMEMDMGIEIPQSSIDRLASSLGLEMPILMEPRHFILPRID
jgi:hypothetical protein